MVSTPHTSRARETMRLLAIPGAWRAVQPGAPVLRAVALAAAVLSVGTGWAQPASQPAPATPPAEMATEDDVPEFETADLDDIELLDIDVPVVVTAAREEQRITEVPHAVSIITAKDIRRAGARTVPDALRLAPGMDVADLSFGMSAVAPRGFHGFLSRQVLVLVDGRQIYDSLFGGTVWGSWPLQIEDIERIEVIRGPGGVTWGANAVNGVVNIITKDPADQVGLTMTAGGGSRGWTREHLGYAFADEKLRLRISAEYEGSDGFRRGGYPLFTFDDDYKTGRGNVKAIMCLNEWDTLTFSAGHASMDGGFPRMPLAGFGMAKNPGAQASYVQLHWEHQAAENDRVEVMFYVNDFGAAPGAKMADYRYQQYALQLSHTFKPAAQHRVRWGIDTRADVLDAGYADPQWLMDDFVSTAIIGMYVQDEWQFAPRWRLNLGARVDYESYGGFQPSARASLSYALRDDAMVYGAVSRAFQMPSVGLRHLEGPFLNGLGYATANRSVNAESLLAYEIGYRGMHFDRLQLGAALFWHEFDDLTTLSPRLGPPGLLRFHLDNRASSSLYGVELDAQYDVTDALALLGHYTYQQLRWRSSAAYHEKDLLSPPKHKFMVGARYDVTADWHLAGHLYFTDGVDAPNPLSPFGGKHIDEYFRLDLMVEHEFWKDRGSLAFGVRNLLDNHHPEGATLFLTDGEVPRMLFAELRLRFK
jgi:iron complex outermembrane receptor protein